MLSDQLQVISQVLPALDALGVVYMVSGSTAMNVYATPRMTRDVDIVIDLNEANLGGFLGIFAEVYYLDEQSIREAVSARDMFNVIHLELAVKLDFMVLKDSEYRRLELSRRQRLEIPGGEVWVVTPEDLMLSKLVWSRRSRSEQQRQDVQNLIASVETLDWSYLERWAKELRIAEQLAEVRP